MAESNETTTVAAIVIEKVRRDVWRGMAGLLGFAGS
jgi:hypothetical protein